MAELKLKLLAAVLCDEVRTENNGKHIIIGAYGGDIILPETPVTLPLAVWISAKVIVSGQAKLDVQFRVNGTEASGIQTELQSEDLDAYVGLPMPRVPVKCSAGSTLQVRWRLGEQDWETLVERSIQLVAQEPKAMLG